MEDFQFAAQENRSWPEDAEHENGRYQNRCCKCKEIFIGHKRRVVCKSCSPSDKATTQQGRELLARFHVLLGRLHADTISANELLEFYRLFPVVVKLAEEGLDVREAIQRRPEVTAEDVARDPRGCIWQLALTLEEREERIATLEATNAGLVARVGELEKALRPFAAKAHFFNTVNNSQLVDIGCRAGELHRAEAAMQDGGTKP